MSLPPHRRPQPWRDASAFSLIELLVAMVVLVLLVGLITLLFSSAQKITGLGNQHMDADEQARAVFDRMAIDFGQMVKRGDIDCFVKDNNRRQLGGNDQIAFYSQAPGYYLDSGTPSPFSVVGYRINNKAGNFARNQMQRFGCGLPWNSYSAGASIPPLAFLPSTISQSWPAATSMDGTANVETAGPQVFRFEYYYVLKGQVTTTGTLPSVLSAIPWDTRAGVAHTAVNGMKDVAAIGVVIAIIDPKAQLLITTDKLGTLATSMDDFDASSHAVPGALEAAWQTKIKASGLPGLVISTIRIYRRWYYLPPSPYSIP